ncbi:MAG: DEAD/DEAH box helicase family protein, partial [Bacteroidota bacterium]|nr:DEAD/DEAH box helicase family protein [Bacteroidota bacterium]
KDPYAILDPKIRWYPADEALRAVGGYEKLLPPFVPALREEIQKWRNQGYGGASTTSISLLNWWFIDRHEIADLEGNLQEFRYYFAQREAVETIIWLHDVAKIKDKHDLMRYDQLGRVSANMFQEDWLRYVIKMATGSGKTKVMSLLLAWAYFHKLYEADSDLAKNFLLIAPNIIVLERLKADFGGLKIFYEDPILPDNGYGGQNWSDDFQITLHLQDEVGTISTTGNLFLTNIHRVYETDVDVPSAADEDTRDYFLGPKPVAKTNDSKVDLGKIVRDLDELVVFNDEAHHIHDEKLTWFTSLQDIHNKLAQKGSKIALQIDVTATPKDTKGRLFPQTVTDYPLVEAIHQKIVKKPVLPDEASRAKIHDHESAMFVERYQDYINLGVAEWKKASAELEKSGKKAILFVMTDDTTNCDDVATYLYYTYTELHGAVMTIHTNTSGDVSENVRGRNEEELKQLRKQANSIDSNESKYKAIVSVLMLKEGWDVRNVTTIVGLRAYNSPARILPEQTLGRGLRRMFFGREDVDEYVSVVGTPAFMEFVEAIKNEGVELEYWEMSQRSKAITPQVIEVDHSNPNKDIEKLDIEVPILSPRVYREYKNLADLDVSKFSHHKVTIKQFSPKEVREIIFKDIVEGKEHHKTNVETVLEPNYQSVIGYFAQTIMKELRLFGCYDILFGKVKIFVQDYLFESKVKLEDPVILRNLSEQEAKRTIIQNFKDAINKLTVQDHGDAEIRNYIKISQARPFVVNNKEFLEPKKTVFNKIVGDSNLEMLFADWLDRCPDVESFTKIYPEIHFKLEYQNADGTIAHYIPDFFVKSGHKTIYVVETKGREDLDDPLKIARLKNWCIDVNKQQKIVRYEY